MKTGFFTEAWPPLVCQAAGIAASRFPWSRAVLALFLLTVNGPATLAQSQSHPSLNLSDLPDAPAPKSLSSPQPFPQATAAPSPAQRKKPGKGALTATFGILSRRSLFFPELAHEKGPLTFKQKFDLASDESIAPSRFLSSAFTAGFEQARNAIPGYGQGAEGYGKRFGSSMATTAASNLFSAFVLASAFHQDPRYFVRPNGTFGQRIGHALRRMAITPTDSGGEAFNWSGILGALLAEGLANSYLPDQERTAGMTFQRFGIRIGASAGLNVLREYWPNIFKGLGMQKLVQDPSGNP